MVSRLAIQTGQRGGDTIESDDLLLTMHLGIQIVKIKLADSRI